MSAGSVISFIRRSLALLFQYGCAVSMASAAIAVLIPIVFVLPGGVFEGVTMNLGDIAMTADFLFILSTIGFLAAFYSALDMLIYGTLPVFALLLSFEIGETRPSRRTFALIGAAAGICMTFLSFYGYEIVTNVPIAIIVPIVAGALGGLTIRYLQDRPPFWPLRR